MLLFVQKCFQFNKKKKNWEKPIHLLRLILTRKIQNRKIETASIVQFTKSTPIDCRISKCQFSFCDISMRQQPTSQPVTTEFYSFNSIALHKIVYDEKISHFDLILFVHDFLFNQSSAIVRLIVVEFFLFSAVHKRSYNQCEKVFKNACRY